GLQGTVQAALLQPMVAAVGETEFRESVGTSERMHHAIVGRPAEPVDQLGGVQFVDKRAKRHNVTLLLLCVASTRSQTPVWERTLLKLRFVFGLRRTKQSFAKARSQTGVWERD